MKIIYPTDWGIIGKSPEIVISEVRNYRKITPLLSKVVDGKFIPIDDIEFVEHRSSNGSVRLYQLPNLSEDGAYIVGFTENRFGYVIKQTGFSLNTTTNQVSLIPALDIIDTLALQAQSMRIIGNGIGKSGTTWLYRLLGSLPGMTAIDMDAAGLQGIDHNDLAKVPFGNVYHGHLPFGLEVVKALEENDFHNVHIYRDLRDVVVSEYFHKFHMEPANHHTDLTRMTKSELLKFENIMKWSSTLCMANQALSWNESSDCVMVKYEDLLQNTETELEAIFKKLGLSTHSALTQYIINRNDFIAVTGRKKGDANHKSPLRNAVVGNWREHLDSDTAKKITQCYQHYFNTFGYNG